jgi:hypothetical protein
LILEKEQLVVLIFESFHRFYGTDSLLALREKALANSERSLYPHGAITTGITSHAGFILSNATFSGTILIREKSSQKM